MQARNVIAGAVAIAAALLGTGPAAAHCDAEDGPVVAAARTALSTGTVEHALIWVREDDEKVVRAAFVRARAERANGDAAAQRGDRAFFAELIRVHREGEGASFEGIKPAGTIEPSVAAADRALASGRIAEVETPLVARTRAALRERFGDARSRRNFAPTDVAAGRAYVAAYVRYVHQVEAMDAAAELGDLHSTHAKPGPASGADGNAAARAHRHDGL